VAFSANGRTEANERLDLQDQVRSLVGLFARGSRHWQCTRKAKAQARVSRCYAMAARGDISEACQRLRWRLSILLKLWRAAATRRPLV